MTAELLTESQCHEVIGLEACGGDATADYWAPGESYISIPLCTEHAMDSDQTQIIWRNT